MANRTKVLETLSEYFKTKGRVLNSQEYARETDTPIRIQQVKNIFGSWNRLEKLLMARDERVTSDQITDVDDILRQRNADAWEAAKQWKLASENQDKKARREAEAQVVAEKLALNAATPEGANANKIAIGGPLPSEQPDYDAMGATVSVDPKTNEPTVVDPEPEEVTTTVENPKTPLELRDKVAAEGVTKTGNVPTGNATSGGATGEASVATLNALGAEGDDNEVKTPEVKTTTAKTSDKK